uniref:Bcl-2 Bcl-2 homology region 1-3 domain-containing protein n=1 Tax=Strigamia maritima TaxID=126957 RepID=T1IVG1_STRMM
MMLDATSTPTTHLSRFTGTLTRGARRGSYPAVFGCPMSSTATLGVPTPAELTKRRLSHVSEAMSRRLSASLTTIGWRSNASHTQDIVDQAKSLCSQYIRNRLKRSGIFKRKLGLQRLRSVIGMTVSYGTCEVFNQLNSVGKELERLYPTLYSSVCRQICFTITSEEVLHNMFTAVATELFRTDITWAKIVALYAVTGGLAADCVQQGHVNYLLCLIESLGLFVEKHLAIWIAHQGGWNTLSSYYLKPHKPFSSEIYLFLIVTIGVIVLAVGLVWIVFKA